MLDKQYHLYSIDTGHFFSNRENTLHHKILAYRQEHRALQNRLSQPDCSGQEALRLKSLGDHKNQKAKQAKEKLLALLSNKAGQNELTGGKDHIRVLREDRLKDTDVISVFDSFLSRSMGIGQDQLTEDLMVVQVYYFDVFKDICFHGFQYKSEKYRYFTSSAGQIRQKKAVFIKESVWNHIEKTIMCGLTIDKINQKGGNNVNKHLAYLALTNSATDEWKEFDIDKSIVIDDFQTEVYGTFDFLDDVEYSITRKTDYVPIPHTDGAGMMLPAVSSKNFMFRAPWIKGLLGVFDFRRFIEENHLSPEITDIYGAKHDIVKEDIQIIFTRSQFKMHKYYDSWEEYKIYFKKYHCRAGRLNVEEDQFKPAKINYQMLQTLTDITDEEIALLAEKSSQKIQNICTSKEAMMEVLGITPYNTSMTPFQKAVKIYPALLGDTYAKDVLRDVKNSLVKKYRGGKLEINGKYTFILPDYYAACEYWFGHMENPKGLLADGEVYCRPARWSEKIDCLRSPHLYREHAIRSNIASQSYGPRSEEIGQWFSTNALYTSAHDLISKLLQFDVDGDKAFIVSDETFVQAARRSMKDIVPLYYNMKKSEPTLLNRKTIYDGLRKAFTSGNIGIYSNAISKIWNHEVFLNGSGQEKQEALDTIKLLCMENNFCIDSAKTLYMPARPEWFAARVSRYTNRKLPAFFQFAKDKEPSQVEARNESLVNKLYNRIPDKGINTRGLMLESPDYKKMMADKNTVCPKEVSRLYDALNKQYRHMINMKDEHRDNLQYVACKITEEFRRLGYPDQVVADMLTEYVYGHEKRYKQLLWFCYGRYIAQNLEKNLKVPKTKFIQCADCGEWLEVPANSRSFRCRTCQRKSSRARPPMSAPHNRPSSMAGSRQGP